LFLEIYAKTGPGVTYVSIVTALWSSSKGFYTIIIGLNSVFDIEEKRNYFFLRFLGMIYTIVFGIVIILSLVLLVFGKIIKNKLVSFFPSMDHILSEVLQMRLVVSVMIMIVIFMLIYHVIPNRRSNFRSQFPGALIAALGWIIISEVFSILLDRFAGYVGENGLIETPPDFMFVDWIYIDEISMHHPPKALGQTCLCAFYHGALLTAAKIFRELGREGDAIHCEANAASLKAAVNALLYDSEKGLYFDGLNTPTPEELLYRYMPQNIEKRYYMPHSNILCALYGLCDDETGRRLIRAVVADKEWGAIQPYFMHFLLQAIDRLDLRDQCTLSVLENWKAPILACPRGLVEGFIPPEPTYSFDHSHAWSGTPLYTIPSIRWALKSSNPAIRKSA
jgi:YihY family inner membrane protein